MSLYRITTDLGGSTFLGSEQTPYIRSDGRYIRVSAPFLEVGNKILIQKDSIAKKTLHEVDDVLESRVERYRDAKSVLFEKNAEGVYIPVLRTELLRGLNYYTPTMVDKPPQETEDKILKNHGTDFRKGDLTELINLTQEIVENYAEKKDIEAPQRAAINLWLNGSVIAPKNYQFFEALAEINPYFNEVFKSFESEEGEFKKAYDILVGHRRGIMAYIARQHLEDNEGESGDNWNRPSKGSITEAIESIVTEFGSEIESQFADAEILNIDRIEDEFECSIRADAIADPNLFKGVYTGEDVPESREVITLDGIFSEPGLLTIALSDSNLFFSRGIKMADEFGFPKQMIEDALLEIVIGFEQALYSSSKDTE